MRYVEVVSRPLIGGVFFFAATGKLRSRKAFGEFTDSLRGFLLLPLSSRMLRMVASAVVTAELVVVVALLAVPAAVLAGHLVGVALLAVFTVVTAAATRWSDRPTCRCFGGRGSRIGRVHVARNAALPFVACAGLVAASPL